MALTLACVSPMLQVDGVKRIDANDLDDTAAAAVRQNLELNDSRASGLVNPTQGDVRLAALQVCKPSCFVAVHAFCDHEPHSSCILVAAGREE